MPDATYLSIVIFAAAVPYSSVSHAGVSGLLGLVLAIAGVKLILARH